MFFTHTIDAVLDGSKTMTRRRVAPDDVVEGELGAVARVLRRSGFRRRVLYELGQLHAVQRGRAQRSEGRIRLTAIRREPVAAISPDDVVAEGAKSFAEFVELWDRMYGVGAAAREDCYVLTFELVRKGG